MSLPETKDGCCTECGSADLTLAQDTTVYTDCKLVDGRWQQGDERTEPTDGEESIRLFCPNCGEYFAVPESLP
jgi:hypothetical protein